MIPGEVPRGPTTAPCQYPNVHVDYSDVPIGSFGTIVSTFAATSPQVGIDNVA